MKLFKNSFYLGPDLSEGPLPTLFYFALSAEESLSIDPYNQPAAFLKNYPIRVFSLDLPGHGPKLPAIEGMSRWAEKITSDHNFVAEFVHQVKEIVDALHLEHLLIPGKCAVAGLSRGAFMATHAAAEIAEMTTILGFAPLTQLTFAKEFQELSSHPLALSLNISQLLPSLIGKTLRFYIGNRDIRVGTARCFQCIEALTELSFESKIRSPQVELLIKPSIGQYGHGTSKDVFQEGAAWVWNQVGA